MENDTSSGFYRLGAGNWGWASAGSGKFQLLGGTVTAVNGVVIGWNSGAINTAIDSGISRVGAATLVFGNGVQGNSGGSMIANVWAQSPDAGATQHARLQPTGVEIGNADTYLIASTSNASGTPDTGISRTGAAKIGFGNGTNGNTSATIEGRAMQLDGSTSGSVTVAVPAVAGANTLNHSRDDGHVRRTVHERYAEK